MQVESLVVKNWGPLKSAKWNLDLTSNVALLCGPHGSGKSTFLNALIYGLGILFGPKLPAIARIKEDKYSIQFTLSPNCEKDEQLLKHQRAFQYPSLTVLKNLRQQVFEYFVPFAAVTPHLLVFRHW